MRIALGLEYDGATFSGWQSQPHGNTVQDVLERALGVIAGAPIRLVCAGRTDAGVHALEQVVHFDTDVERPSSAWVRGVNAHLPSSVAVLWADVVSSEFHARYSAHARTYRYLLLNRPVRAALFEDKVGWCHSPLDVGAMREAAAHLIGEHDFSAFRAAECQAKTPVKVLHSAKISSQDRLIAFDFVANAFLHHMVRNIVGALVYVGKGRYSPGWISELLEHGDRCRAAPTFSASGLYFVSVSYGSEWRLPMRDHMMPPIATYLT